MNPEKVEELGVQLRETLWLTDVAAVPERPSTNGELAALLVTVTLPVTLPAEAGAKATLNEVVCPAARVTGKPIGDRLKPVPLAVICEMVTLAFPVLLTVTVCVALVPMARFPKLNELGLAESCKMEETPVPLRGMLSAGFEALLVSVILPAMLPANVGAKATLNEDERPGATESGVVSPDRE